MKPKTKWIVVHSDDGYPSPYWARRHHKRTHWLRLPIDLYHLIEEWREDEFDNDDQIAGVTADWMKDNWNLLKCYNPGKVKALQKLLAFMVAFGVEDFSWGYGQKIKEVKSEYS